MTALNLRYHPNLLAIAAFLLAGVVMLGVSFGAALVIEGRSEKSVSATLTHNSIDWVTVQADGLQVHLAGTAPNEAARFRAVNLVGSIVDSSRVRDFLDVTPTSAIEAPKFSVQMLRNDDGVQLIGLMPETPDEGGLTEESLTTAAAELTPGIEVASMLEAAAYPAPATWNASLAFGLDALKTLKRAKISVDADRIAISAISDSEAEKRRLEADLTSRKPEGVRVIMDISAPRPVITPFTLRFVIDEGGPHFDACSADTERARNQILAAANAAGLQGTPPCTIGLGVPTPRWAEATAAGIKAVQELGAGSVTFSDADVTLLAAETVTQAAFDRVVGELETALPDVFSLESTLAKKETGANLGPADFTATLSAEGKVELRGRLSDERLRSVVDAFAKAQFGSSDVYIATRLDPDLPDGWPVRVLTGLEALSELANGALTVRADTVEVSGETGSQQARAKITQLLSSKLGQGQTFKVAVTYKEDLDPFAALPTPQECATEVNAALATQKITFTPGSAEIASTAQPVIAALSDILKDCPAIKMEIAGYTDSQGSEGGNQALSQARAEAVMVALQGRRIDVSGMTSVGYGEAFPIADNATEEGREANRRIEFVLKEPAVAVQPAAQVEASSPAVAETPAIETGANMAKDAGEAAGPETTPETATKAVEGPDFSGDTSPSVAPTERTIRPQPRPTRG